MNRHFLAIFFVASCVSFITPSRAESCPPFKGMFVFGSSLVDNGNNNFLHTLVKADYAPYGIDYTVPKSGRFTNNKNVIDLLGVQLGLKNPIPPYYHPDTKGKNILQGVDFACGGMGVLDITGRIEGNAATMNQQINKFETITLIDLEAQLGDAKKILPQYLFVIGVAGNDFSLLFSGLNVTKAEIEIFTEKVLKTLTSQIQKLYYLGARKFVVMSVYPIGCSPSKLDKHLKCDEWMNKAICTYNDRLREIVRRIDKPLPGACAVFVDVYKIVMDITNNPKPHGFTNTTRSCCETSRLKKGVLCKKNATVCNNRDQYMYFDGLHPTSAVNVLIATKACESKQPSEVCPYNIKELLKKL